MPYGRLQDSDRVNLDASIWDDYWHAHCAWRSGDEVAAFHLYKNLRRDHGIELYYEISLKSPTRFVHPIGAVLGRAEYAEYLVVYQGCSVGSTVDNERPTFTGPCVLLPHSGVIGPVTVGKNVWISAGTIVEARPGKPVVIPPDSVVFRAKDITHRLTKRSVLDTYFPANPRTGERI